MPQPYRLRVLDGGDVEGDLDAVSGLIRDSRNTTALTGAGISVESGIPDFRSPGGLWTVYDPMEYATLTCFLRDPDKAWKLYRAIGAALAGRKPNAAHRALADLESAGRLEAVITQNMDGLHQAAGSRTVLEIHGDGRGLECLWCRRNEPLLPSHLESGPVPRCEACGRALKPTFVLYEEPVRSLDRIQRVLSRSDLLLAIGTSAQVTPASLFPDEVRRRGGRVIELNIESTLPASILEGGAFVQGPAGITLPRVVERALSFRAPEAT